MQMRRRSPDQTKTQTTEELVQRADDVCAQFLLDDEVYLIGSMEDAVTVYSQQLRVHNLIWSLWELDSRMDRHAESVAIIGGGIAGLTAAACTLGQFGNTHVTLFERSTDLCPLQQGCDSRWLHPRIFRWPEPESRGPSASLPVLNWHEGRASDVADEVLRAFGRYCDKSSRKNRLTTYLGVSHLKIRSSDREIEWTGYRSERDGDYFRAVEAEGSKRKFDRIIIAVGFGPETQTPSVKTPPYWQNEDFAQPVTDGTIRPYFVSGYGDGALVDLCRLTIERFRQDRIVYDLFGAELEGAEITLDNIIDTEKVGSLFDVFESLDNSLLKPARQNLVKRIRKDTHVTLHLAGRHGNKSVPEVFRKTTSVLNQLLLYLLYRCGAFAPSFDRLDDAIAKFAGPKERIICRHGALTAGHVARIFLDETRIARKLDEFKAKQRQLVRREWHPGSFMT